MKKENFSIKTTTHPPANAQILLEGHLLIRNAAIIKKELLSALANSQNLELILRNVTKADMAFLQLLVALQKSTANLEKNLSFDIEPTDYMKSIIDYSGLRENLAIGVQA
ncbi:MAG: STAS domain-containing protein [Ginsengibacter sp.]